MNIETGAKLSETFGTVEELCTWHDERTMTGEERRRDREASHCASSNSVNTAWSHRGDCLKEPTTGRADESGERWYAHLSGLGCVGARAWERTGLVEQESYGRTTRCKM